MKIDIGIHWIGFKKLCFTVVAIAKFWSEFSVGFVTADDTNRLPALDVQTQCEIDSSQFLVFALRGSPQVLRFVFGPSEISTSFPRVSETITEVQIVFVATREGNRISSFRTCLHFISFAKSKVLESVYTSMNAGNRRALNPVKRGAHSSFPNPANFNSRYCSIEIDSIPGDNNLLLWSWWALSLFPYTIFFFIGILIIILSFIAFIKMFITHCGLESWGLKMKTISYHDWQRVSQRHTTQRHIREILLDFLLPSSTLAPSSLFSVSTLCFFLGLASAGFFSFFLTTGGNKASNL